ASWPFGPMPYRDAWTTPPLGKSRPSARTTPSSFGPRVYAAGTTGWPCGPMSIGASAGLWALPNWFSSDILSGVLVHPPPRPASNTNAAAVRFIRTYSGRCALVGRRRAFRPRPGIVQTQTNSRIGYGRDFE